MAHVPGYEISHVHRPSFCTDGVVVARRPIVVGEARRQVQPGEVVTVEDLGGERSLVIHQRNFLVDTLPPGTKVEGIEPPKPEPPKKQAAPPQRGR